MKNRTKEGFVVKLITGIVLIAFLCYLLLMVWAYNADPSMPLWLQGLFSGTTVLVVISLMIMMLIVGQRRLKEINEEDEDDLSEY